MWRFLLGLTLVGAGACATGVEPEEIDDPIDPVGSGGAGTSTSSTTSGGGSIPPSCGDGTAQGDEQCDGTDTRQVSCNSLGFLGGDVLCRSDCTLDINGCYNSLCGNGTIEMGEDCDGTNLGGQDCVSAGFSGGTLDCDDQCLFTGCFDAYAEGFEGGALPSGWGSTGTGVWTVTMTQPYEGSHAAQSANISDSQSTGMTIAVTFDTAGTISFYHRESTESSFDYLQFYIDGGFQQEWSGTNAWAMASFNVPAGVHTFEWRYDKDGSVSSGSDLVWVDQISTTNGYIP